MEDLEIWYFIARRWGKAGVAKVRGLGTSAHTLGRKLTARRQIRRANKSLRRQLKVRASSASVLQES